MLGNSFNLVDMIRAHLTGEVVGRMSSFLGEDSDRTRLGMLAAVPALLGGLDRVASTSDGAARIHSAIDNADTNITDNVIGLFGRTTTVDTGGGILRSILGAGNLSDVNNLVSRTSGLSGRSTTSMLSLLAPIVLGVLARLKRSAGAGFSIASLLADQRANIAAAMPEETTEETYAGPRIAPRRREAEAYTTPKTARSESNWPSWLLPLALFAGALGLLWYLAARPHTTRAAYDDLTPMARTMVTLEALKAKYAPVLREARVQGVQISEIRQENGKLLIRGVAPSQEAANKVWDKIKSVNPSMDDITAEFRIPSISQSPPMPETPSALPAMDTSQTYTVQKGDTLRSISQHFYGKPQDFRRIYDANRGKIKNANVISPGQELEIPR